MDLLWRGLSYLVRVKFYPWKFHYTLSVAVPTLSTQQRSGHLCISKMWAHRTAMKPSKEKNGLIEELFEKLPLHFFTKNLPSLRLQYYFVPHLCYTELSNRECYTIFSNVTVVVV